MIRIKAKERQTLARPLGFKMLSQIELDIEFQNKLGDKQKITP